MHTTVLAKVHKETREGTYFIVLAPQQSLTDTVKSYSVGGRLSGELRIDDGRTITADQRKKTYAMLRDIADWNGDLPELLKEDMKYAYVAATGEDYFSLSDCSVTTARLFINFLIDFALEWNVPLRDTALNRTDDIDAAIYSSLKHKRCIICGQDGEVHHAEDRVGIGRNRHEIVHIGMRIMCLCRQHHNECHLVGQKTFNDLYHVYGITTDKEICEIWRLKDE